MRVDAPGSGGRRTRQKSCELDGGSDSDGGSAILDADSEDSHDSMSLEPYRDDGDEYPPADRVQGAYASFVACLHRLQGAFQAMGEVIEEVDVG